MSLNLDSKFLNQDSRVFSNLMHDASGQIFS